MPRQDLVTYEVWLDDDTLLHSFQDEIGLSDNDVYTAAIADLQSTLDKIQSPSPDSRVVRVGVIHPPAVSVRRQIRQDDLAGE